MSAPTPCAIPSPHSSLWTNRASDSPPRPPASISTTTSAKATRCSDAACPIWTCTPPPAPRASTPAAQSPTRPHRFRRARRSRHHPLGRPGSTNRGNHLGSVGPPGARRGPRSRRRTHPPRRLYRLGQRRTNTGLADALTTWFGPPSGSEPLGRSSPIVHDWGTGVAPAFGKPIDCR